MTDGGGPQSVARVEVGESGLFLDLVGDVQERGGSVVSTVSAWRTTEQGPEEVHRDRLILLDHEPRRRFARAVCAVVTDADESQVQLALLKLGQAVPIAAATAAQDRADRASDDDGLARYFAERGELYWRKPTPAGGVSVVKLANFAAWIAALIEVDDGAERWSEAEIAGELGVGGDGAPVELPTVRVRAEDFLTLSWVPRLWGLAPTIEPGDSSREHLRFAIQSGAARGTRLGAVRRRVFAHAGWREVGGRWVFLTASGAIGGDGLDPSVAVELGESMQALALPAPPVGAELVAAIRASLGLWRLGVDPIVVAALFGAIYLAPLRELLARSGLAPDFLLWLHNGSGAYKTSLATLAQMHFGAWDRTRLPASFEATANAMGRVAFVMKDCLMLVDDLHEATDPQQHRSMLNTASRLLRQAGNLSSRLRLSADMVMRSAEPPRSLVVVTAESLPVGDSNTRRAFTVYVPRPAEEVGRAIREAHALAGQYAAAMAGYLSWLARSYDRLPAELPARLRVLRESGTATAGSERAPGQIAALQLGVETFLAFAVEAGALAPAEASELNREAALALLRGSIDGQVHRAEQSPVARALGLLDAGFATRRVYLEDADQGGPPSDGDRWGWERYPSVGMREPTPTFAPHAAGAHPIGWREHGWLMFDSSTLGGFLAAAARAAGQPPPLDMTSLLLRLDEAGLIDVELEPGKRRRVVRGRVRGRRQRVIRLSDEYREWIEGERDKKEGRGGTENGPT